MFYHPSDSELDTKIKDIGLSEAIIKFTRFVYFAYLFCHLIVFVVIEEMWAKVPHTHSYWFWVSRQNRVIFIVFIDNTVYTHSIYWQCSCLFGYSTFTSDESVYCMRTQKTLQLFFNPENDFWMIMVKFAFSAWINCFIHYFYPNRFRL